MDGEGKEEAVKAGKNSGVEPQRATSLMQLNECIRVASPGSWLLLAAVFLLLLGIGVWGVFGRLDTKARAAVVVRGGEIYAYVLDDEIPKIEPGKELVFGDSSYRVSSISDDPICVDDTFQEYIRYVGGFEFGDWVRTLDAGAARPEIADGVYRAEVITESTSPLSFLMN